jgi:CRISPR/Cas system-associated exonuclease Cas4 (RecB family)
VSTPQFTAWSASRLADYDKCPRYAKLKHLVPEYKGWDKGGAAANRGTQIHEAAAGYIAGHTKTLDKALKNVTVEKLVKTLRKGYIADLVWVELMWCFDKSWQLLKDKFSPDVWLRVKCDVIDFSKSGHIEIIDWKTGRFKPNEDHDEQLTLYTTAAVSAYEVESASASLMFTDVGQRVDRPNTNCTSAELRAAQKRWEKRVKPMLSDRWFAPKPGPACQWCPYARNENGPCEF